MDDNIPIDIHYNKLLDWLVDRRHCDSKWHSQSKSIRSRVSKAVADLPKENSEVSKILQESGEGLTYFDCKNILEVLKKIDGESTTLFGQYSAPRVKDWAEVVKSYEQKHVYLAECGQFLTRLVKYEVPALKQQLGKCQHNIRDCSRREGELKVHAAALLESYRNVCAGMGIKGDNVASELSQLTSSLPEVYQQLLDDLPSLQPTIKYYHDFLTATREKHPPVEAHFLPMLHYVITNGNTTVYQWRHGKPCPSLRPNQSESESTNVNVSELDIDWGGMETGIDAPVDGGIDFGEIDFGAVEDVDLGICVEDAGITVEGDGGGADDGGGAATDGEEKPTSENNEDVSDNDPLPDVEEGDTDLLLENKTTKNRFLDDIHELKEFISRRKIEAASEGISIIQMGTLDEFAAVECGLDEMLGHVTKILDHMTNQRVQHLFLIKGSPRYLQRLADKLTQDLKLSQKANRQVTETEAKREQVEISLKKLQPQYAHMVARTKNLQKLMSEEISKLYKGRRVNIMGEINQIT